MPLIKSATFKFLAEKKYYKSKYHKIQCLFLIDILKCCRFSISIRFSVASYTLVL